MRAAIPSWARAALGLLALAGLAALAVLRPRLPTMPWQPLQPTDRRARPPSRRSSLVWLLLVAICLRLAWLALKPPRRVGSEDVRSAELAARTSARASCDASGPTRANCFELFSRPRSVSLTEIGPASEASDALESQTVEGTAEAAGDGGAPQVMVSLFGRLRVGGADGNACR